MAKILDYLSYSSLTRHSYDYYYNLMHEEAKALRGMETSRSHNC